MLRYKPFKPNSQLSRILRRAFEGLCRFQRKTVMLPNNKTSTIVAASYKQTVSELYEFNFLVQLLVQLDFFLPIKIK